MQKKKKKKKKKNGSSVGTYPSTFVHVLVQKLCALNFAPQKLGRSLGSLSTEGQCWLGPFPK